MGISTDTVLDLIGEVYDATAAPDGWQRVADRFSDELGGAAVLFGIQRLPSGIPTATFARLDPNCVALFQRDHADASANMAGAMQRQGFPTLVLREQLVSQEAYHRSALYNEVLRPEGIDEFALATLVRSTSYMVPFWVSQRDGRGPFEPDELSLLDRLLPHLQRAMQLHLRLGDLKAGNDALVAGLHRLAVGAILLDANARILFCNRAAEEILSAKDGLTTRAGRLVAGSVRDARQLEALVAAAAATTARQGTSPGDSMMLMRPSLLRPLTVVVSPLAASGSPEGAAVILFVADPEARIAPSERLLSTLYGLTAAEAALAARLLEGQEMAEAARSLRIGMPTARTHLSRILAKTGTRRQAELLRLLLRGPAGLDYRNG